MTLKVFFNSELIDQLLANQEKVELLKNASIEQYAESSAKIAGEVFRFTAKLKQNETILYKIGYHVGKIVYLIDSCIDILDDVEKKQFNALLAANGSTPSQHKIVRLVIDSLQIIKNLTKQLTLYKHRALIEGILLQGFPTRLHQQVHKSIPKLQKNRFVPFNYLPHAALASALCLFANEANAAGFVWGEEYTGYYDVDSCCRGHFREYKEYKIYGLTCSLENNVPTKNFINEALLNPFVCISSSDESGILCCNIPKYIFSYALCYRIHFNKSISLKAKKIILALEIFVIIMVVIGVNYNFISETYEKYQIEKSVNFFVENTSPELYSNRQKINENITAINTKIQNLQKLQSQYPAQTDVIQPKIEKLNALNRYLENTLHNIQVQIKTAYVIHKANKIEGIGQSISLDDVLKKANDALQHAKSVNLSVEEMTQ